MYAETVVTETIVGTIVAEQPLCESASDRTQFLNASVNTVLTIKNTFSRCLFFTFVLFHWKKIHENIVLLVAL